VSKNGKISRGTVLGISVIILAALISFVLFPLAVGLIGRTTDIVRVKEKIRVGDMISDANIEMVNVSGYNLPMDVMKDQKDAIGKYATATLEPGDYILKSKLVDNMITSGNYMNSLDGNKQIISISIKDFASGVSGKIMPGNIVQVLNNALVVNNRSTAYPELQYLKVVAVTSSTGVDMCGEKVTDQSELPATVSLRVNKAQAQLLSGLEKTGNIYFSVIWSGDLETANQFLQKQDEVLTSSGNF